MTVKQFTLFIVALLHSVLVVAQIEIDSFLAMPQTLELEMSTVQPRLHETFTITLDASYIRADIFKSAMDNLKVVENAGSIYSDNKMVFHVTALQKGKNEIGPLSFTLNGTNYTTNKLEFEVIDDLPDTDEGVWFRYGKTSDSSFYLIIEQRIPADMKKKSISKSTVSYSYVPEREETVRLSNRYSMDNLRSEASNSNSEIKSFYNKKGNRIEFLSSYCISYFTIKNKSQKVIFVESDFINLPKGYRFKDILIE